MKHLSLSFAQARMVGLMKIENQFAQSIHICDRTKLRYSYHNVNSEYYSSIKYDTYTRVIVPRKKVFIFGE
jgi:hypothetical protein